jgi:predicted ATPase
MDTLTAIPYQLNNMGKINIVLGKNGCGKSTLLKKIDENICQNPAYGIVKYITPERGGNLVYEASIEQNIANNERWLSDTRRVNRVENFRQQSVAQFRNLELLFLREMEKNPSLRNDHSHTFDKLYNKLNQLLDNIEIRPDKASFKIYKKGAEEEINSSSISSGESELLALGIECLIFEKECSNEKENVLFLDEPDVHLHPDAQAKLCQFIRELVKEKNITIILATHSTPILGALEEDENTRFAFMISDQKQLEFEKISEQHRKILPVFGAHPLSNLFNKTPIFLLEGEDDERIWQQAIRSSNRKLKIYPCSVDGLPHLLEYEREVSKIIDCVYEDATAYSLRDKDDSPDDTLENFQNIKRFKLACRAAENLLLTEEVLKELEIDWKDLQIKINEWLSSNPSHPHHAIMTIFSKNYDRKDFDLKEIRNDLMHIIGKPIAWELAVGKTIGKLISQNKLDNNDDNSIVAYLGSNLHSFLSTKNCS